MMSAIPMTKTTKRAPNVVLLLGLFALMAFCSSGADGKRNVKVFILAGKAKVSLLEYQVAQPATRPLFAHLQKDGKWIERSDVFIKFLEREGPLTVGYGSPKCIGPELQFGWTVGDRYDEPVLLIKTAWGGRSLWRDFRPPSAGFAADAALQKMLADAQKKKPETTLDDIQKPFGASYREMLTEVNTTLSDLKKHFPSLEGCTPDLAGLIWFQGWNDMISADYTSEYATNLVHFIHDVRRDLKSPKLPFVIAQMGVDGTNASRNIQKFKSAQAAVMDLPEFRRDVALVKTDAFWDYEADAVFKNGWSENLAEWNKVGSDYPYHYLGSVRTLNQIGLACAQAVLELRGKSSDRFPEKARGRKLLPG
jgi:alpha-galactosidase